MPIVQNLIFRNFSSMNKYYYYINEIHLIVCIFNIYIYIYNEMPYTIAQSILHHM